MEMEMGELTVVYSLAGLGLGDPESHTHTHTLGWVRFEPATWEV